MQFSRRYSTSVLTTILNMVQPDQLSELFQLGRAVYSLILTLLVLSWIVVALRLWVRIRITKAPGWDDATMLFALV